MSEVARHCCLVSGEVGDSLRTEAPHCCRRHLPDGRCTPTTVLILRTAEIEIETQGEGGHIDSETHAFVTVMLLLTLGYLSVCGPP